MVTPPSPVWVASMGGPLLVLPRSALDQWSGCTEGGTIAGTGDVRDDYDRACEVEGTAGVLQVGDGGSQAIVLGDMPSTTCFLPAHRAFVRRLAPGPEALDAAEALLTDAATTWEECGTWETDGAAVLMDSAEAGADLDVEYPGGGRPEQAPVAVPAGRWRVRASRGSRPDTSAEVIHLVAEVEGACVTGGVRDA